MEVGRSGLVHERLPGKDDPDMAAKAYHANAERIFYIRHALRLGIGIEEIYAISKIDRGS